MVRVKAGGFLKHVPQISAVGTGHRQIGQQFLESRGNSISHSKHKSSDVVAPHKTQLQSVNNFIGIYPKD